MAGHKKWKEIPRKRKGVEDPAPMGSIDAEVEDGLKNTAELTRAVLNVPKEEAAEPPRTGRHA